MSILTDLMMQFADGLTQQSQTAQLQGTQQRVGNGELDITNNPRIREVVEAYAKRFTNEKVLEGLIVEGDAGGRVGKTEEDGKIILDPEWRKWDSATLDRLLGHELKHRADYAQIPLKKYNAHDAMPEEIQPYELIAEHRGAQFASERAKRLIPPFKGYIGVPPVRWP